MVLTRVMTIILKIELMISRECWLQASARVTFAFSLFPLVGFSLRLPLTMGGSQVRVMLVLIFCRCWLLTEIVAHNRRTQVEWCWCWFRYNADAELKKILRDGPGKSEWPPAHMFRGWLRKVTLIKAFQTCVFVFVFLFLFVMQTFLHIFIFLHIVYLLVYPIYAFRVWQLSTRGPLAEHWFSRPVSLFCHHLICICII